MGSFASKANIDSAPELSSSVGTNKQTFIKTGMLSIIKTIPEEITLLQKSTSNKNHVFKLDEINYATNKVMEERQIDQNKTNSNSSSLRRTYRKAFVGANKNVTAVKSVPKLGYLHVYRLSAETNPTDLIQALQITASHIPFKSEPLYKNDKTCSMIVTFPITHVHEVYVPEICPKVQ